MTLRAPLLLALLAGACASAHLDPYAEGERAKTRGDLAVALQAFDRVPVHHPRYPEARSTASAVERQMRRGHEHFLGGIRLRSEWREAEALVEFELARSVWPDMPGLGELIAATQSRIEVFQTPADTGEESGSSVMTTRPSGAARPADAPPAQAGETRPSGGSLPRGDRERPEPPDGGTVMGPGRQEPTPGPAVARGEPSPATTRESGTEPLVTPVPVPGATTARQLSATGEDEIGAQLVALEDRLLKGQVEGALADLIRLHQLWPNEARIRHRLARLLHQRALLRYGQGSITSAVADWSQALELRPDWPEVRTLLRKAEDEANRVTRN